MYMQGEDRLHIEWSLCLQHFCFAKRSRRTCLISFFIAGLGLFRDLERNWILFYFSYKNSLNQNRIWINSNLYLVNSNFSEVSIRLDSVCKYWLCTSVNYAITTIQWYVTCCRYGTRQIYFYLSLKLAQSSSLPLKGWQGRYFVSHDLQKDWH